MEGTTLEAFPKLRLPKPPEEVAKDPDVQRTILAYWRGADELRVKMASNVPYVRGGGKAAPKPLHDAARPEERSGGGRDERRHDR